MSKALLTDFVVDKEHNQIKVERAFNAPRQLVWKAWTTPEILDLWWAPKPWKTETVEMHFEEGGFWHYYMAGPEGERHYCTADYQTINEPANFSYQDAFCDENRVINEQHPRMSWNTRFTDQGDKTLVNITIAYDKLADLEAILEMGFKEGFTMAIGNLDEWLAEHK